MKVINKTKQYFKENWKPLLVITGVSVCSGIVYAIGHKRGIKFLGENLSKAFGIKMNDAYAYNTITTTLRETGWGEESLEQLKKYGFENLDEKLTATILLQKTES